MSAAGARLNKTKEVSRADPPYESLVWKQVIQRLERRAQPRPDDPAYEPPPVSQMRVIQEPRTSPPDPELEELRQVVLLRRKMAERLAAIARSHQDSVWNKIEARIGARHRKGVFHSIFHRAKKDTQAGDLTRLLGGVSLSEQSAQSPGDRASIRRAAFIGAAAAVSILGVAALLIAGPSSHPMAQATRIAGEQLGIVESGRAPAPSPVDAAITPVPVTASEASELLGVPVTAPETLPGFTLASSLFFSEPISADNGGTFAVTYRGEDAGRSLAVYQELASGAAFSVGTGSATGVVLDDGTPATYVEGGWSPATAVDLTWDAEAAAQTLIFERGGARTIISYTGPAVDASFLVSLADNLR